MNTTFKSVPNDEFDPQAQLSLREAARLAGVPREYLEECVASGKLGVHLHHKGEVTKFRVTREALSAAGILPEKPKPPAVEPNQKLVELLRTQAERLTAIEEQRFQLAGQLGAALERNRILEEQTLALALAASLKSDDSVELASAEAETHRARRAAAPAMQLEPPSAEPSLHAPYKLAVRIIRLEPAARWSRRTLNAIPGLRSLIIGKRGGPNEH